MKRHASPQTAQSGIQHSPIVEQVRGCERPRIRYSVGRMILDQHGERVIGLKARSFGRMQR
jgi:hypothetical protein